MLGARKKKPTGEGWLCKSPPRDVVGTLSVRSRHPSIAVCAPATVITVTAVKQLYRVQGQGAIPHLGDTATLFCKKANLSGDPITPLAPMVLMVLMAVA